MRAKPMAATMRCKPILQVRRFGVVQANGLGVGANSVGDSFRSQSAPAMVDKQRIGIGCLLLLRPQPPLQDTRALLVEKDGRFTALRGFQLDRLPLPIDIVDIDVAEFVATDTGLR